MAVQPPQAHSHGKYNTGKGWCFRFDDDKKIGFDIYKYILSIT